MRRRSAPRRGQHDRRVHQHDGADDPGGRRRRERDRRLRARHHRARRGTTVSGETAATYTLAGLTNGVTYNVVVAAVDAFGNIGPPSPQNCDYPAPVNDFFKVYRGAGGGAGGGFCALEAVGAPAGSTVAFGGAGALLFAAVRRRRRKNP
jgi:hypothetical protein